MPGIPGDFYPSDQAEADQVVPHVPALDRWAAAPALPEAAVVLRPAGLPVEKNSSFIIFFGRSEKNNENYYFFQQANQLGEEQPRPLVALVQLPHGEDPVRQARVDLLLLGLRHSSHQGLATFLQLPLLDLQRSEKNKMLTFGGGERRTLDTNSSCWV